MTTSSRYPSKAPIPTQNPAPDGRIAPIRRHNNRHAIPGQYWWMLYLLARVDGKTVFRELEQAIQEYGSRRGVFVGPDGVRSECPLCGACLKVANVSARLLKRGVWACEECITMLDRQRAEFIRNREEEKAYEEEQGQSMREQDDREGHRGSPPVSINAMRADRR